MRFIISSATLGRFSIAFCFSLIISCGLFIAPGAIAQDGYAGGDDIAEEESVVPPSQVPPPPEETAGRSRVEELFRAAKGRTNFAVINIFESRDIWRGIDWFVDNDPAYLLGGEAVFDCTPYSEQRKRDIWEVKLYNMVAGAWGLKSGHENVDRWKVCTTLQNRFFKYVDLDIGYEHYGLRPFDDHDRDFDEFIMRTGINSVPTFRPLTVPGFKEPITAIPFGVHYGAYYSSSSKNFSLTNDTYGFHGYPAKDWWWHEVAFELIVPFPDMVPERTRGILKGLKLDSVMWIIDNANALRNLPKGIQDAEFGIALPLAFGLGKELNLDNHLWGLFGRSQFSVIPFLRYAVDAQNLDRKSGTWSDKDEIWGGVVLVCAF
jgi:hypothetical protein